MTLKDDYIPPVFLSDEARNLNDQFYLILNNLVASFPFSKIKPDGKTIYNNSITNKVDYDNNMANMLQLQNDYFLYKNSVVSNSQAVLKEMHEIDKQINIIDQQNAILRTQVNELSNSGRSAEGMLDDSQITRNQMFYGNVILFIIMASGGYLYYKKVYSVAAQ
jgi:hypothetical protein